jgi:hypothetical protein
MRNDCRSAPRKAGRRGRARRYGRRRTWWWEDGVRFTVHGGTVFGWVLGFTGVPVKCGSWPAAPLFGDDPRAAVEGWAMSLLRKADKGIPKSGEPVASAEDGMASRWPTLFAFLSQMRWEDDTARVPGSMLTFVQDGMFKGMLRDKNDGTCLWVASRTLEGLFDAVEGSLCDPGADWRVDRQGPNDRATRVRKG